MKTYGLTGFLSSSAPVNGPTKGTRASVKMGSEAAEILMDRLGAVLAGDFVSGDFGRGLGSFYRARHFRPALGPPIAIPPAPIAVASSIAVASTVIAITAITAIAVA